MSLKEIVPAGNGVKGDPFSVPLATHEDVVKDPTLFSSTLRTFHYAMGTKFMIPVIGGKDLNLHVLYIEVTKRGGYDQVVTDKKWREISVFFDFSPTTTSASYALRKHYFTLLFGYEQAYFFRHQRPVIDPSGHSTFQAIGTIEGKFDCGYLISVKHGEEILNGVLYHPGSSSTSMQHRNTVTVATQLHDEHGKGRQRRRRRRRGGDSGRPKPNRSGYNFFFAEKHSILKSLYPNREREFTKMIAESWNKLTPEERIVYQNHGLKDKERYHKEMVEYKERMKIE
ncbi:unnamed protein product [Fraxinus pennsylvanica]|uniref:Uncharacterized protein n=1 Tax=Fraxinus pennsylvanica TaxID=56036 RepID=A0AAD2DRR7_9LAMI|nr:unnamed protein product [Fraxinus pennsylvanica]